ncbi:hypothetical protein CYL18_16210 [Pradoshia eiseniae]|uniref:Uncharacterized protein n=2 Tax=Pradoshia eiseniae TaxID=2064768 RepID=A0A2S7MWJ1_9BACI|nr:hypothetical protein CYL18_16210 [Pradoshia eiseniae]
MDRSTVEKEAKKYKKLLENYYVMPFAFEENGHKWMLVQYNRFPKKDDAIGFAIFPERQMTLDEKEYIMGNFSSIFGGLLRIRNAVKPRIDVSEELARTNERINLLLDKWADNAERKLMVEKFKEFSDYVLWCQKEKKEKFRVAAEIEHKLFETFTFTSEDRQRLLEVFPHFDVLIYLQQRRMYEQLDSNHQLLTSIKRDKGRLSREDASYVTEILAAYYDRKSAREFVQVLEEEFTLFKEDLMAGRESYEKLLEFSAEKYALKEADDLRSNMGMLRN